MSSEIAIKVESLSKCYQIYDNPRDRLLQMLARGRKQYFREFWALSGISFELNKGETIGIVGRNGSGKSTLLQLICGTLNPTSGSVQANGRIAALLELGSGFNPEFNGRENVYMNAALLGLKMEEINARFDQIAAFADIGEFIDQPVKTYSSGMFVRLAFAVNIMSNPEIMVVDEALAVGDMAFQAKCMTALRRMQDRGVTVLFVSHDIGSIKSLCTRAAYLEHGKLKSFGKAALVVEKFEREMREEMNTQNKPSLQCDNENSENLNSSILKTNALSSYKTSDAFDHRVAQFRYGLGGARISFVELLDLDDRPLLSAEFNQQIKIKIYLSSDIETSLSVNYYIQDDKKNLIMGAGLGVIGEPLIKCRPNSRWMVTYISVLPLQEGNYSIQVQLTKPIIRDQTAEFIDVIDNAVVFNVQRRQSGRIWTKVFIENTVEITQNI